MRPFLFTQPCRIWPTWVFNYIVRIIGSDLNDYSCKGIRLNYHETVASASVIFAALAAPLVGLWRDHCAARSTCLIIHYSKISLFRKPKHLGCIWRMIKFLETEKDSPKASKYPISLLSSSKSHTDFTLGCMKKEGLKIYPALMVTVSDPLLSIFEVTRVTWLLPHKKHKAAAFMIFQSSLSLERNLIA